ncbi:S8 family peptidase [Fredinandcohnia humi]
MKQILSIVIAFSLFAPFVQQANAEVPTEKVIIVFKDKIDEKLVEKYNGKVDQVSNHVPVVTGEVPVTAIDNLEQSNKVVSVEPDQVIKVTGQVQDWGIEKVSAPKSWKANYTGAGIKVAVLDTGISTHEDLHVAGGVSFTSYTNSYSDDNGHGTHVAGIIGAKNNQVGIVGVAPDASIYAVKVLDQEGSGYLSDIILGIDWAITNKMDIINLSLGAPADSLALKQAVDRAYNKGILVVASAGNSGNTDGSGDTVQYPAKYDSTIAVAAIDSQNMRGIFSSTGTKVEIAAPGVGILSTYLGNKYVKMDGTSMAAPYVAGVLAILKQANPTMSHIQLRQKLQTNAIDLGVQGRDPFYGYGLAQAPTQANAVVSPVTTEAPVGEAPVTTPSSQPVKAPVISPKPVQKKKISTTITTAKSVYNLGNTIWPTVKVIDTVSKKPVSGAVVKLTFTPPKGKATTITVKTNSKGIAPFKYVTTKKSGKGTYKISTTITGANYVTGSASKIVKVK